MNKGKSINAYVLIENYANEQNGEFTITPLAVSTDWNKIHDLWKETVKKTEIDEDVYEIERDDKIGHFSAYKPDEYLTNHYDLIIHTTKSI